jgi:hypothetical protein
MERKGQEGYNQENRFTQEEICPYSEDGVDLTLIRWMLSLTPTGRLQVLQQNIRSIMRLKGERTDT